MIFVITLRITQDTVRGRLFDTNSEGNFLSIRVILPTSTESGTLPSWNAEKITSVNMLTKHGPACLSMATVTSRDLAKNVKISQAPIARCS